MDWLIGREQPMEIDCWKKQMDESDQGTQLIREQKEENQNQIIIRAFAPSIEASPWHMWNFPLETAMYHRIYTPSRLVILNLLMPN